MRNICIGALIGVVSLATSSAAFPSLLRSGSVPAADAILGHRIIDGRHYPHKGGDGMNIYGGGGNDDANSHDCPVLKQMARKFVAPAVPTNFTSKMIPDEHHQFRPPCVYDKRGPCPALNTLANHGYIPRNGVATAEQIIEAVVEGFGMHPDVAGFLVGYGVLTRGNANLAMLSIGDADDELIPALPGCLDGKVAGGISKPGRFEGDISLTRSDAGSSPTGDAAKFNPALYDQLLLYVGKYGNSTTGVDPTTINEAIVTNTVFEKFIPARFAFEQKNDKSLNFNIGRLLVDFAATGLILELFPSFPNGVKENLTVSQLDSFFRNERFPENWVRRAPLANLGDLAPTAGGLIVGSGVLPGRNVEGKFVQDKLDANTLLCDGYTSILQHDIPEILTSAAVTGVFKENVQAMLGLILKPFADLAGCTRVEPGGKAGL